MSEETVHTNIRDLPVWVRDELKKEADYQKRSVNGQIIVVLREWAQKRKEAGH